MTSEFTIAVHALVYLNHKKEILSSDALAKNVCTNPVRIRKVMGMLKKKGMVGTREGLEGGYYMEKKASDINLGQIANALEIPIVKASWKSGDRDMDCLVASGMAGIIDGICKELDELCREYLEGITIEDIDHKIFGARLEAGVGKAK